MADDKLTGFLSKDTAGLPNWAWILVVGAGIAAVYVLPKFFPGAGKSPSSSTGSTDTSGLGLAVDPTTGLPYAVEGLVPGGGTVGTGGTGGVISTDTGGTVPGVPCPPPSMPSCPHGSVPTPTRDANGCVTYICTPIGPDIKPPPETQYNQLDYTVKANDSISTIAKWFGVTPDALYALNPSLNLQQYGLNGIVPPGILIHVHSPTNAPASASVTPAVTAQRAALNARWPGAA